METPIFVSASQNTTLEKPLWRKLKSRIENTPNGNASISQKLPYIAKKFLRSHEVVFQAIRKRNISQNCNGNVFFTFTGHMAYVKSHIIILQCTITSKNYFIRARSRI